MDTHSIKMIKYNFNDISVPECNNALIFIIELLNVIKCHSITLEQLAYKCIHLIKCIGTKNKLSKYHH